MDLLTAALCGNVLFIGSVVGLFAGRRAEAVSVPGLIGLVWLSAPTTMFSKT